MERKYSCTFAFSSCTLTFVHDRIVHWLFLDLNSYFASVEQELRPELRGRPIAVVPVVAETTCCIAASYEARAYGVRTGCAVRVARSLCPHLELVEARPKLYVEMHHRIVAAIETCLPIEAVLSCDEFVCRLQGRQREPSRAVQLASEVKASIRARAGTTLRCSIGLGPSRLLAKIAAEMQKPDGLMVIERRHLPQALHCLELSAVPGIGERMEGKLRRAGVSTMRALCALSRERMGALWGSVVGERLWLELCGEDLPAPVTRPLQTISRQHILPPELRSTEGCRATALKLLQDCVRRMRRVGMGACGLGVAVYFLHHEYVFEAGCRVPFSQDGITLQEHFLPLLAGMPHQIAQSVCVFLTHLEPAHTAELFASPELGKRVAVAGTMEQLHRRFGKDAVFLGSVHEVRNAAPARISFGPPPPLEEFGE